MKGYKSFGDIDRPAAESGIKYLDWERAERLCIENPRATIMAGPREDWGYTSEIIFRNGMWVKKDPNDSLYDSSRWATPIIDIDGEEIECYLGDDCPEEKQLSGRPAWWGRGDAIVVN
jgi:hypothetical protein